MKLIESIQKLLDRFREFLLSRSFSKHYFRLKGKRAEEIVHELAIKTFLTDWCFLNPKLPNGNELCDLLVVFDDTAIIWQIKDLKLNENGKYKKAEVDKNLRQLLGARRQLFDLKTPIELENSRRRKEKFNSNSIRKTFFISVLLGKGEEVFSFVEEVKNNTIHVFTKEFLSVVLNELDTVSDFVDYLREKEKFLKKNDFLMVMGGEEELLAVYLMNERRFDRFKKSNSVLIDEGSWKHLQHKPEYQAKKRADRVSYGWDSMINNAHNTPSEEYERVARELARPNRFERRYLTQAFMDAHIRADKDTVNNSYRRVTFGNGITYCFLFQDDPEPRDHRKSHLGAMCWVARGKYQKNKKVLGIATEKKIRPMASYDFCLLDIPVWTKENQANMEDIQRKTGILMNPEFMRVQAHEYPIRRKVNK